MAEQLSAGQVGAALEYAAKGWAVFPLHNVKQGRCSCGRDCGASAGKHPLSINGFKDATRDPAKIREFWKRHPNANIGLATGKISGIVALDIDPRNGGIQSLARFEAEKGRLPNTLTALTGGGGEHRFFKCPQAGLKSSKGFMSGLDLKADGGYVVAPPSLHKSGKKYRWKEPRVPIAGLPKALGLPITSRSAHSHNAKGVTEGGRNDEMTRVAGMLRRIGFGREQILENLRRSNIERCVPPLKDAELQGIATSVASYPSGADEKEAESYASQIARIADSCELFHDENNQSWARLTIGGHKEQWPCDSTQFRFYLAHESYKRLGKVAGSEALKTAGHIIAAKAQFDGKQILLYNRFARVGDVFYYDLCDPVWGAVRVEAGKWGIVLEPPILFRRYEHQRPQVRPARNGDARKILEFVNLHDEDQKVLFLVAMVAMFVPDIGHPVLIPHGEQGAAKSSMLRLLRRISDPSAVELLTFPRDGRQLPLQFLHSAVPMYDNVSRLSREDSDAICRAVTGDGVIVRKLFHDQDEVIFQFKRPIGINGINIVATQPDLLDRSILFRLDPIKPGARRTDEEIDAAFERARPIILGGIFDALAKAMTIKKRLPAPREFRMADFAHWGCAIAEAMDIGQKRFLAAYRRNVEGHTAEAIENSPVASALMDLMKARDVWSGNATQLFMELERRADALNLPRPPGWPAAPNALGRKLVEVRTILRRAGVEVIDSRDERRHITIRKLKKTVEVDETGEEITDGFDGTDSNSTRSPASKSEEIVEEDE